MRAETESPFGDEKEGVTSRGAECSLSAHRRPSRHGTINPFEEEDHPHFAGLRRRDGELVEVIFQIISYHITSHGEEVCGPEQHRHVSHHFLQRRLTLFWPLGCSPPI